MARGSAIQQCSIYGAPERLFRDKWKRVCHIGMYRGVVLVGARLVCACVYVRARARVCVCVCVCVCV
jgi:hypothetical protein